MIACVDVGYGHGDRDPAAVAACVLFRDWADEVASDEKSVAIDAVDDYVPGEFYKRELPCILRVLAKVNGPLDAIVIDGYVWLGDIDRPGLGGRLFEALGRLTPVIGVAKNRFVGAKLAVEVLRGGSAKPLYVTAAGMDSTVAAANIKAMHGAFRIPTLLKRVDQLCRISP